MNKVGKHIFFSNEGGNSEISNFDDSRSKPQYKLKIKPTKPIYCSCSTRPTRYSISKYYITKYIEPKCPTVTNQKSYLIRCIRIWNTLTDELNLFMARLTFKDVMSKYYFSALSNYDCENPRTLKYVCLKCNKCRSLARPISCCF